MIFVRDGNKLKQDIIDTCKTITKAAKLTGYSKAYISSIITGVRNPNSKVSINLCELTGGKFEDYFFISSVNKKITKISK